MSLKNAYSFITSKANICDYTNSKQIQNELQYMFQRYDLQPAIYISYNRCAYCVKQKDKDIFRITFDDNILYRTSDLKLESGSFGEELLQKDFCIMEVKGITMPLWLTHTLNELKLYPTSFSKYGYMYMTAPKERKKERRFD